MKRTLYLILAFGFLLLWSSCRKDFEFSPSNGTLEFSRDTIYLDTIFTNIGSSTYNLKVYNRSSEDIYIPSVKLANGEDSGYRLNVDGIPGKSFENVELLAKDSLYIFIETTFNTSTNPPPANEFLYTDKIEFDSNSIVQDVDLVTLIKDAVLIYPDRSTVVDPETQEITQVIETLTLEVNGEQIETDIRGRELLPEELTFTNEKPYVIYGYAAVPNGEALTVNAGARIHFHAESGLIVSEGASLNVNGALSADQDLLENEVIFEGDRLEPVFSDVPGQWGTIWLFENSENNIINYATIKNATVGVLSDANANAPIDKLTISNSKIYNSSAFGILGRNTSITGENLVLNRAGQSSLACTFGGKYNFTHSTITNYWNNSFRQFPALLVNNFVTDADNNNVITDLVEANFNNCIIYGNDNPELILDEVNENNAVDFNFKFTNCLIKFENIDDLIGPIENYENVIFNKDTNFRDASNNDLIIGDDSEANGLANPIFTAQVPFDILGIDRTASPDIGAYQHITFE